MGRTYYAGGDVEEGGERVGCQDYRVGHFVDPKGEEPEPGDNEAEGAHESAEAGDGRNLIDDLMLA